MLGYGVFSVGGGTPRVGWRDGDEVTDLSALGDVFMQPSLNALMALGRDASAELLAPARAHDGPRFHIDEVTAQLPVQIGDFVDFNSSLEHASSIGRMFRPQGDPLPVNWRWVPIGYQSRAGSVVVSGTDVRRPNGQRKTGDTPTFGPSERLDIELELGFVIGTPSAHGEPVTVDDAADHVFGVALLNDWSARDIQAWEYVPLGPFLSKSFQTSMAAWVTPLALLEEHRVESPLQEPPPLAYLDGGRDWALDIPLEIELNGEVISRSNVRTLYWTMPQQLAHATSNGAALRTGDLFGSGTVSGSEPGTGGSLIELTQNERFLADGDEIVLRGRGLAEVRGRVAPAGLIIPASYGERPIVLPAGVQALRSGNGEDPGQRGGP
ncbi:MAG TPA: fumarylacetoacetate hydrolase family protein [Gaiellaceae bacterium]